jgi:hypothetical protein
MEQFVRKYYELVPIISNSYVTISKNVILTFTSACSAVPRYHPTSLGKVRSGTTGF